MTIVSRFHLNCQIFERILDLHAVVHVHVVSAVGPGFSFGHAGVLGIRTLQPAYIYLLLKHLLRRDNRGEFIAQRRNIVEVYHLRGKKIPGTIRKRKGYTGILNKNHLKTIICRHPHSSRHTMR